MTVALTVASHIAKAAAVLLPLTIMRMWFHPESATKLRPFFPRVPMALLVVLVVPLLSIPVLCGILLTFFTYRTTLAMAMFTSFSIGVLVLYLIVQRTCLLRSERFYFIFKRDRYDEGSLHVKARHPHPNKVPSLSDKRSLVLSLGPELGRALDVLRLLPAEVRRLTVTSPWFGHERHRTASVRLRHQLENAFPTARIEPISWKVSRFREYRLRLLAPTLSKQWDATAKGGRWEMAGYVVIRNP